MLKYLFQCIYKDNTTYEQTEDDVSITDPTRSSFYDVKMDELALFALHGDGHTFQVNLIDGSFWVDGNKFRMHDETDKLTNEFRLIFFRRHKHEFSPELNELAHKTTYRIGWQCNDIDGKNIQRVMEIL